MTQQPTPARRKGSVGDRDLAAAASPASSTSTSNSGRAQTPSRQFPQDRKSASATSSNNKQPSAARAASAPKQRGKGGVTSASQAPPSRYDTALARMKQTAEGKSEEELQLLLQQLLRGARFSDAAYLIAASSALAAKFKVSDVVRLMLEHKQFESTAQLIREMKLQSNQLLVTLFIKELVRSAHFHAAVRYAQEMVQNFGKKDFGPRDHERPSWTPQALIQAMVRALHFKTALKFAKQFELLEIFPVRPLVASMFEARQWEDAISSVMEFRLFVDFPLEALIAKMLAERQWSLAVKCMGKVQSKEALDKFADALVRESARAGDFVTARKYLGEYKLEANRPLLEHLIASMILYKEMYKAIKYAIKFGLHEASEGGGASFPTESLIRKAIEVGQFHVASFYIKKLRLKDQFASELAEIEQKQQVRLQEFREFIRFREAQLNQPTAQQQLVTLLGDKMETDADFVVMEPVTTEVVLSEIEEIIPRRKKEEEEEEAAGADMKAPPDVAGVITGDSGLDASRASESIYHDGGRQSRFSFARADAMAENSLASHPGNTNPYERAQVSQMPPGLAAFPTAARAEESVSSFNFAQFASALQNNTALMPPPTQHNQPSTHSAPPGMQAGQSNSQAGLFAPPMPNSHFQQAPMPPPPHMGYAPMYSQGGGFMQNMNGSQALPPAPGFMAPPPPSSAPQNPTDISSLAMQFHSGSGSRGPLPAFGMNNNNSGGLNFAPQMHPGPPPTTTHSSPAALSHLFPSSFAPPLPPPQFAQPPRSSFKPSMAYTSVTTTTRQT